jgi:hypothetical protein
MRIATQSQVTTKVNAIKQALNSFNYSHRCIYYYSNNTINSSWSTNIELPNDGKSYRVVLCYTFSANPNQGDQSSRYGMIVDLAVGNHTERVIQGFSSACQYYFNASKNNISTGVVSLVFTGTGQTIPVSITLNFKGSSTLQEDPNLSGFQLAVVEIPGTIVYERM